MLHHLAPDGVMAGIDAAAEASEARAVELAGSSGLEREPVGVN